LLILKDAVLMTNETEIQNLIARYLNGECSDGETISLLEWCNRSDRNLKEFLIAKDIWDLANKRADKSESQLINFYRKQLESSKKSRIILINRLIAVAAVLVVALVAAILYPRNADHPVEQFSIFTVPLGSRSKVVLFDGTEVHLNSGSTLTYSNRFDGNPRKVTLTGEAFFKVKSDKRHPFVVKTTDFEVNATGTQFNVCTYDNDPFSSATLAEGAVSLRMNNSNQLFTINPGEKFRMNRMKNNFLQAAADVESELAWKDGEFIFKNIPFPELVQRLERWYDVKLVWSGKNLESYAYTGRFKNQETIWQVLDALKLTSRINYQKISFREFRIIYKSKI
jgi:ferric-dicitrate binding protein FerR (iron transport regulator)